MNGYVRLEKNPLVRAVPLEIKKYFMMAGANLGSRSVTAVYSNIGILRFPEEYKAYIDRFGIFASTNSLQLCSCSYEDQMVLGFTSKIPDDSIQKNFMRMLREEEIPYKEEKNDFPGCGEQNKKEEIKILQTFTFLCLAVAVICGMINYLMLETLNWFWFAAAGCACAWLVVNVAYFKRRNILKNLTWQLLIITVLCVLWDHFTGWKGWSIDFVFPFGTLTVLGSIPVIAKINHLEREEYLLILGARKGEDKRKQTGRLVHFTSKDLKKWEFKGDFWAPGIYTMFEMPEIFKMGDWWYLVFSEYSEGNKIHYRRSKNLYGPWEAPFDDAFDGKAYYAGRTAFDGERRVLFGWVPTRIDNDDKNAYLWGGTFVPHEVFQKEDGTLGVKPVDQMMEAFDGWKDLFNPCMKTIDTKEETLLCEDTGSIAAFKTTVKFEEGTKEFSIRFYKDEETEVSYEYRFFVEENKVVFNKCPNYPWYQCFNIGLERPIKLEADKEYEICLIIDQDISTLYINGTALNARLCDHPGNGLALTVTDGTLEAKNTKIATKINK